MSSMSVRNRVAMFEVGKEGENPVKRPSTPNSFKRPTTPKSPAFGQSLLKPTTPSRAKTFNGKELSSPKGRSSWPWPPEDNVIPVPEKDSSLKTGGYRRFSSSSLPPTAGPVVLPLRSPMSKSSVANIPLPPHQHPSKVQSTTEGSSLKKNVYSLSPSPAFPSPLRSVTTVPSENKTPNTSDKATRNKALQLAKSRNGQISSAPRTGKVDVPRGVEEQRDDDASSRNSDPELSSINGHSMNMDEKSLFSTNTAYDASDAPSTGTAPDTVASGSTGQLSRAGKLSQAQRRSNTPDPVRSQSPMPAVRGTMTLSNVSHKEARKALLQAAQRKKEKADAIKLEEEQEKEAKAASGTDELSLEDQSKRSDGSVADRVATKALNVLKMKNSMLFGGDIKTRESSESNRDSEGSCNGSVASASSRLKTHPAFAARAASPRFSSQLARSVTLMAGTAKPTGETKADGAAKAFSEELFSSFRHFHELRPEQKKVGSSAGAIMTIETGKAAQGRPPQPSPMWNKSPRTLKDAMAAGKGTLSQSFDIPSPVTDNNVGRYSIDSNESPFEPEESLHSTSEHNFDRRWMDSTGQPRYAASHQTFRQQEGGFLSSLSGNTVSTVSMISSAVEQGQLSIRVLDNGANALGDISTPTMRSAHSMAHSIISTSPRVEKSERKGNEYEYLLNTPSQHSIVDVHATVMKPIPNGVPSQIIEEEDESAAPSAGPHVEVTSEPTLVISNENRPMENKSTKDTIIPIQASYSAADAPAGFVFHDEDTEGSIEERLSGVPDPEGRSFDAREESHNDKAVTETSTTPVEKSTSTKGSVSLRSGISDAQSEHNAKVSESPREGSKSIHSGLSALQNGSDLEGSTSIRSISVSMKSTTMFENDPTAEPGVEQTPTKPKEPMMKGSHFDTIVEADDEEASAMKAVDDLHLTNPPPTEETKPDVEGSQDQQDHTDSQSDCRKQVLPSSLTVTAKPEKVDEDLSVASSPTSLSMWKMKIPNLVKSVLAKASPRHDPGQTPKAQIAEECLSTSADEEDIFGGLEDELSKVMGGVTKKEEEPPSSMRSAGVVAKSSSTPRAPPTANRFFSSGHTRKSEPPPRRNPSTPKHRSIRSEARSTPGERKKTPKSGLSLKSLRQRLTSPRNAGNRTPVNEDSANDRSGTEVVEQAMEHVNSDITSSVLGAPLQKKPPVTPMKTEGEEDLFGKTPKSKTSKITPTSAKAKTPKIDNHSVTDKSGFSKGHSVADKSGFSKGKDTLFDGTAFAEETILDEATRATSAFQESTSEEDKAEEPASMFMGFGCGLSDAFAVVSKVCHFGKDDDDEPEVKTVDGVDDMATYISADATNNSSSHLTELEKRVWNEWDKLDSVFSKANQTPKSEKSKDSHDNKREVARGKLLEIANSAISSQMTKEGDQSGASISYSTGTSNDSGDTGNSSGLSGSSSEGASSGGGSSGSEGASEVVKHSTTTPILLSFSQRSLIEKFSKQLTHHGIEVLKLNRRMQWQPRYFAISKEQIALIAHEAKTKSGAEVAQCPKALLWLKKFSSKNGGYSLSHIDKNGHGGMLLVDLKDIQVSADHQDLKSPLPKKFADKFKDSVMMALEYEFSGEKRRIEFRCKDNDEAQFLCTCMRVIRDLLKREQALRLKTQSQKKKNKKNLLTVISTRVETAKESCLAEAEASFIKNLIGSSSRSIAYQVCNPHGHDGTTVSNTFSSTLLSNGRHSRSQMEEDIEWLFDDNEELRFTPLE